LRVVFVRHGARRSTEADPALTSAGHQMAAETGDWLLSHRIVARRCLVTPTLRTRQTAEGLLGRLPELRAELVPFLPESRDDWDALVAQERPLVGDHGVLLAVGHHPTLAFLLRCFGPAPVSVPLDHFATALVLDPIFTGSWAISAAWPGRTG